MRIPLILPFLGMVLASSLAAAQSGLPQSVLPPALPWTGASERLIAAKDDPWITPAERADFVT
jgi:hypothetical protein